MNTQPTNKPIYNQYSKNTQQKSYIIGKLRLMTPSITRHPSLQTAIINVQSIFSFVFFILFSSIFCQTSKLILARKILHVFCMKLFQIYHAIVECVMNISLVKRFVNLYLQSNTHFMVSPYLFQNSFRHKAFNELNN